MTTFKFRPVVKGTHTHVDVFTGPNENELGLAGRLILPNDQWAVLRQIVLSGQPFPETWEDFGVEIEPEEYR